MRLIFAVPDIDREDLLPEILCELLVFLGVFSHERINLVWDGQTTVKNLLDCRLACREEAKLILHHEVVFLRQIDCSTVKFTIFNRFDRSQLHLLSLHSLECVEFEGEEERFGKGFHVRGEGGRCVDSNEFDRKLVGFKNVVVFNLKVRVRLQKTCFGSWVSGEGDWSVIDIDSNSV